MGTSTSWIAIEGTSVEEVARDLGLVPAPAAAIDDSTGSAYSVAMLPNGWVLLVSKLDNDGVVAHGDVLKKLSRGRRVVGCDEESHVMLSASAEWRDGREIWAVIHAAETAPDHVVARGEPPADWIKVKDEHMAMQAKAVKSGEEVDYAYDIPPAVAKLVVGYRTDSDDDDDLDYATFIPASSKSSKPWWRFW